MEKHTLLSASTLALRHPHNLFSENSGDPEMLVTIDLAESDNKTELTLTHERLPDVESRDHHHQGWIGCLDNLEKLVGQ